MRSMARSSSGSNSFGYQWPTFGVTMISPSRPAAFHPAASARGVSIRRFGLSWDGLGERASFRVGGHCLAVSSITCPGRHGSKAFWNQRSITVPSGRISNVFR
jgi:hypothetical protein